MNNSRYGQGFQRNSVAPEHRHFDDDHLNENCQTIPHDEAWAAEADKIPWNIKNPRSPDYTTEGHSCPTINKISPRCVATHTGIALSPIMQPHYMDHDAQDSVVIVGEEQGQEEEEEEDRALEMSVKSLKENDGLPVIRGEELGKVVVPDLLGRRPTLVSRLSHLSINSTETTTEGNSSGGGTLSVNSEEMGLDMHTAIPQVLSSTKSSTASEDAKEDPVPVSHCEGVSKLTKSDPADISPVSDGSGTVFASTKGEDVDSNISRPLSRTAQPFDAGLLDLPSLASTSTSSVTGSSDVQELRSEDAMHDWHHNKEKEQYRHVHEHRQGMKKRSRFRSPAVTAYQAPDHLPFAIYFGSKSTRDASTKGKERDRIPADDFDVLHRDFSSSETQRRAKRTGQDRQTSPQSHHSGTSSEHERAKFDAAIREHQKAVHFQPLAIRPKKPIKAAESSTSAATPERGQQRESKPIVSNTTSSPRHSPRIDSQQGTPGLSRRPSAKRAQSHTMSWDMALLSPAPQRESVEENKLDRENKAKGSVMSLGDAALNLNIIEQAFTAAIDSNSAVAVSGGAPYGSESHPHPTSPSATTISSASSAGSRHRFRSYNGPVLPEIQASTTHAELFYLAFGNGGSSSRQSLIGHTVQKKLERAENDKADRELRATDKAERDERRKHPYNDDFERPVNDDSTTESQSESVTETVESSPMSEPVDKVSKEDEIGEAKERRRKRREAKESRREAKTPSPEPIISAAVIMPLTGMTILTKDGDAITNEPETPSTATINRLNSGLSRNSQASVHAQSTASPRSNVHHGPKIQNSGDTLRPHGTFTTARHPTMAIHADAIRARALISDERFDTINTDQLRAAADAGDQIAEEHLRQRERRSRLLASQGIPPADSKQAEPPSRRRTGITDGGPRRKSSVESAISNSSRKPASPVMQTIQENGAANVKSTKAERKISRHINSQVEQMESRRTSDSTNSSGRSSVSIGSAVEALLDTIGDTNVPINLPIKLSPMSARSRSLDLGDSNVSNQRPNRTGSMPTPFESASRKRSPFISNSAFSTSQELFSAPAFPPVSSSVSPFAHADMAGKDSSFFKDPPFSPTNESELFLDVARLTSLQVEKDRALSRAQEARDRGLATESVGSQRIRTDAAHRSRIRDSVARANATIHPEAAPVEPEIVSAMASFGISYEGNRRPSIDNSLDPLTKSDSKEQRSVERQRRKRMNRQLEHEKVIRETPMSEYSNPFDTHLGGLHQGRQESSQMSQLTENHDEEDEQADTQSTSGPAPVCGATTAGASSGEG